ncbi:MAG: hypothetical protein P9M15_03550 [Candidatus Electryoneaceae bacterium]|nr:hypothetical protein [Candidatus Electryoneaceae bacterium]
MLPGESIMTFNNLLEAIDNLSLDEQETLAEVLHRRLIDQKRTMLAKDIQDTRQEFREGRCQSASPDEIMTEILS